MNDSRSRHMFPGNNTPQGFFSYFDYILPPSQAQRIYCLKGGPGVGKSTILNHIAERVAQQGFDIEYMHCASDPSSLDGIVIPALGVFLVDGTAPHVIDPVYPAAVDEIVNLGEFWDGEAIRRNRNDIIRISGENKWHYSRAFRYLAAAKSLMDDITQTYEAATDKAGAMLLAQSVIDKELAGKQATGRLGTVRRLFASAITPDGIVHYLESLLDGAHTVYFIKNLWGVGVHKLLERISDETVRRGLDVEQYYSPLSPETAIEHLLIPELKLAFCSQNRYYDMKHDPQQTLDLTPYTDSSQITGHRDALQFDTETFDRLLKEAIDVLAQTKGLHDELEVLYIPHMDFARVAQKEAEICEQILRLMEHAR